MNHKGIEAEKEVSNSVNQKLDNLFSSLCRILVKDIVRIIAGVKFMLNQLLLYIIYWVLYKIPAADYRRYIAKTIN